ncbi:MAG: 4Fe-4S dicluster domain-containing protein, partial [Planctomycetaceae bacterium]|nr:4Fe-4S dicluster domain-containing protein [Planctomycetaceae bacterium]
WNFERNAKIQTLQPRADTDWQFTQREADRVQEFRKCIECFLCQNVCHVLRDHDRKEEFIGPRFLVRLASLEMHPVDDADRLEQVKDEFGIGYCNITKCCTEACPEGITITDNAIIPMKERLVDRYYDPVLWLWRKLTGKD